MGETEKNLTAVTSEFGDGRPDRGVGVSVRSNDIEVGYLHATGIEEHAPMDWTPLAAVQLLAEHGYQVVGEWADIDETGGDDPTWQFAITRSGIVATDFGDVVAVECSPDDAVNVLFAIECDPDCPQCYGH
ncbi:hypothetical protein A2J03_22215 [Rhodococcus sp. EPR-157]|uniref:hypothetical protein n=1 Tax=Rhodococcus sp. EPR-157 TaxID=1813677 RepID=UPI0007BB4173|nr:hypothetical protein [Rhodococcus sp. EPR-157]KZF07758.1 hypothetical protein A2J03_22215 [Rhodococcus sp. EPR-157]